MEDRSSSPAVKIGELARRTGLTIATLRFYEREGLIQCQRSETQYRYFPDDTVERIKRIVYLRSLNMPLADIRVVLSATGVGPLDSAELPQLEHQLAKIAEQRLFLTQLEAELRSHIFALRGEVDHERQ